MRRLVYTAIVLLLGTWSAGPVGAGDDPFPDIMDLDLEALLDIEVVSVSKRAQSSLDAAAAVYVLTAEDIRRSGATTLPDALRLVPGLDVRRIDSNKWAVTSRGFNGRFSNKLLVLVDGRSIYTTLFSGVYWEHQDLLLEDLDRIEIIRGPGATMWGANAVNGVINVITKHAADSQGTLVAAQAGSHEEFTGEVRQGVELGDKTYARVSVKTANRASYDHEAGGDAEDDWDLSTAGFRLDAEPGARDALTLQGDWFDGTIGQSIAVFDLAPPYSYAVTERAPIHGGHLRADWRRTLSPTSELSLQAYYDHMDRNELIAHQVRHVFDTELRHRFQAGAHLLSWGGGYRWTSDDIHHSPIVDADQLLREDGLASAYVQDDVNLTDRLHLNLGTKYEHNDYTGGEVQPGVRLLWNLRDRHRLWASVARAVRTPSRAEYDLHVLTAVIPPYSPANPAGVPVAVYIEKNEDFVSEVLTAYELGYRYGGARFNLDLALFYNDYDKLRGTMGAGPFVYDDRIERVFSLHNIVAGRALGGELAVVWTPRAWARLDLGYGYIDTEFTSSGNVGGAQLEQVPRHTFTARTALDLPGRIELDAFLRSFSTSVVTIATTVTGNAELEGVTTLDLRLGWRPSDRWSLSAAAQNLLAGDHVEFVQETFTQATLIRSGWYARATLEF